MCNSLYAAGEQFLFKHSLLILLIDYQQVCVLSEHVALQFLPEADPLPGAHHPHHLSHQSSL